MAICLKFFVTCGGEYLNNEENLIILGNFD